MEQRALLVVDVQPTFCEGGSLPVQGGNAVAERIANFIAARGEEYGRIITTQDWHIDPGRHFSDNPDYIDTWPPHAVADTDEALLHPALKGIDADFAVFKGHYEAAYSGFDGQTKDGLDLTYLLTDFDAVDIVGLAESHCVRDTALDALAQGKKVRVFADLTAPVSAELGAEARRRLEAAGAQYALSSQA